MAGTLFGIAWQNMTSLAVLYLQDMTSNGFTGLQIEISAAKHDSLCIGCLNRIVTS